jgi:hypothetical protein
MGDKGKDRIPRGVSTIFNAPKKSKKIPYGTCDYLVSTALMKQRANYDQDESTNDIATTAKTSSSTTTNKLSKQKSNSSSKKNNNSKAKGKKSAKSRRICSSRSSSRSSSKSRRNSSSCRSSISEKGDNNSQSEGIHEDDMSSDDSQPKRKPKKKSLADPLQHFKTSNKEDYLKCKICEKDGKEKLIKGSSSNDTGLRKHLGNVHHLSNTLYASQLKQKKNITVANSPDTEDSNATYKSNENSSITKTSKERKKELDEAAIDCIAEDGRSYGDLRKNGMLKFLSKAVPGYKPPKRTRVAIRMRANYHRHRWDLKEILKNVKHMSLTTDL